VAMRTGLASEITASIRDGAALHMVVDGASGETLGMSGLTHCARYAYHDAASALLAAGTVVNGAVRQGYTPLMIAASFSNARMLDVLLDAGARVNAVDDDGDTALHRAAMSAHVASVQRLLRAGARADAHNTHGRTPAESVSSHAGSN